jgi:Putative prokaryotic signal transducing protein
MAEGDLIVCPSCARGHPPSERFCESCGMPLVHPTGAASSSKREHEASERQRRARKIKPQYTEGPLVKVANAKGQPEAEFIAGLLLEEGIPCLLRNSIGGYSPLIGPREVMVPASGAEAAREALSFERPNPETAV